MSTNDTSVPFPTRYVSLLDTVEPGDQSLTVERSPLTWSRTWQSVRQWSSKTFQYTRLLFQERFGHLQRTEDIQIEQNIQVRQRRVSLVDLSSSLLVSQRNKRTLPTNLARCSANVHSFLRFNSNSTFSRSITDRHPTSFFLFGRSRRRNRSQQPLPGSPSEQRSTFAE